MNTSSINAPNKIIANWLFVLCGMVFFMVILGGLTRLTHSGLSMVDWRPVTGWLPPLNPGEWQAVFELYKESPEFKKVNFDMTVEDFKSIFWLEFIHRLWGRAMGVVFLLPFIFFLFKGWVTRPLVPKLIFIFILGGLQGVLGWYMVKSGLIDNPDVSQYRLTAHFSAAVVIYGYMFWVALSLMKAPFGAVRKASNGLVAATVVTTIWIFVTMMSGGFVAGLDAGLTYNTYPLMDGDIVPDGLWAMSPWYLNLFENITTVQFNHRILAHLTVLWVFGIWWLVRKSELPMSTRKTFHALMVMVWLQIALGITTLLMAVPVSFASLHQAGSLVVFTFALWATHSLIGRAYN
ncbi:MAG: heme A synthase [Rhodospirillaceae bacterium]|jgi:heme a synthase|nr:heme A synthase [Rhodospirillaceae bacterium]MBT5941761.1 heme A synthase [Rhodospirillaceae bacterium]MBT7267671.1 heme A synthase [Rhodospirillaceae bacterium]